MNEEIDYSLYDVNGDAYVIRIKRREAILYDQDHLMAYRMMNKLKRSGRRPTRSDSGETSPYPSDSFNPVCNSTMSNSSGSSASFVGENDNDLRSPCSKKSRQTVADLNNSFDNLEIKDVNDNTVGEVEKKNGNVLISSWLVEDACHTFINEMGKQILKFNMKRTPRKVYEDISSSMLLKGYSFSSKELYDKKRGLDATFCKLKSNSGIMGKTKWVFYEGIKQLHSGIWPEGFISCSSRSTSLRKDSNISHSEGADADVCNITSGQGADTDVLFDIDPYQGAVADDGVARISESETDNDDFDWDEQSEEMLLKEVFEAKQHFMNMPLLKNVALFDHVTRNLQMKGFNVNREKCTSRYASLKLRFNLEVDKGNSTGQAACKWKHYELMYELEKDSLSTKAVVTVSAGAVYKVNKGVQEEKQTRIGKARPPNATSQQRVAKLVGEDASKKNNWSIGYKNRALDIQERRLRLEERYLEEFQSFRKDAQERGQNFKEGIKLLRELKENK